MGCFISKAIAKQTVARAIDHYTQDNGVALRQSGRDTTLVNENMPKNDRK